LALAVLPLAQRYYRQVHFLRRWYRQFASCLRCRSNLLSGILTRVIGTSGGSTARATASTFSGGSTASAPAAATASIVSFLKCFCYFLGSYRTLQRCHRWVFRQELSAVVPPAYGGGTGSAGWSAGRRRPLNRILAVGVMPQRYYRCSGGGTASARFSPNGQIWDGGYLSPFLLQAL